MDDAKSAMPMPIGNGSIQRELFSFALKQERTMHSHGPLVQACGKNIRKSLLRCCADHPARVADGQAVGRNVLGDDTARANDAVRADRHAGQDDGAGTNPNIVADMNGMRVLQPLQPLPNIHRVFFHDDADAGGDKHVVADGYFSAVHELVVDIEEEVIAHRGVISVGAKEGLLHNTVVSALPSSPRMAACPRTAVQRVYMVAFMELFHRNVAVGHKFGITGLIQQLGIGLFRHRYPFMMDTNIVIPRSSKINDEMGGRKAA